MGALQQLGVAFKGIVAEPHICQIETDTLSVQHTHDNAFAMDRRQCRDAQIQFVALDPHHDASVLR